MKITLQAQKEEQKQEFPALYRAIVSGLEVLFFTENQGIVVTKGESSRDVGDFLEFTPCSYSHVWKKLSGKVIFEV